MSRRLLLIVILFFMLTGSLLAGCGGDAADTNTSSADENAAVESADVSEEPPVAEAAPVEEDVGEEETAVNTQTETVTLTWYFPTINAAGQTDLEDVQAAANEIIGAEINATLILKPVEISEYNEKMRTMAAAGESFDLAYTSWWTFHYFDMAALGAFAPLNDLLDANAPTIRAELPDYVWKANTIDSQIYGVPHWENAAGPSGAMLMTDLVEKYDIDVSSMENYWDIDTYLATVAENEPDLIPHVIGTSGFWEHPIKFGNMERFDAVSFLGFYRDADEVVPINLYATPEYEQYVPVVSEWWQAGYINETAPTSGNTSEIINAGQAGSIFNRNLILDTGTLGGLTYTNVKFGPAILNANSVLAHQTAVSRTSPNPERAVMLLELIRTNADLFQLLTYGVAGEHYSLEDGNRITRTEVSTYNLTFDWIFGDAIHDGFRPATEDPTYLEKFEMALSSAEPSMVLGFVFDPSPVEAEMAQIKATIDQYEPQLSTGAGDWETILPEFLEQLDASGINNVIDEMESQLAIWQASQ